MTSQEKDGDVVVLLSRERGEKGEEGILTFGFSLTVENLKKWGSWSLPTASNHGSLFRHNLPFYGKILIPHLYINNCIFRHNLHSIYLNRIMK